MALVIRLRKMGRTNYHTFRLVVLDKKKPRDGKYIEMVGWYNPYEEDKKSLFVKTQRVQFWLEKGAILSEKAKALVKKAAPDIIKELNQRKIKPKAKKKK